MDKKPTSLSIVVPCHNEQEVLKNTYQTLVDLCNEWKSAGLITAYELVFTNNGSTDNTLALMRELYAKTPNMVIVDLRKDFGFQGSISAGLYHAQHEMVVSIDADLQDDPTKIKDMIEKYYEGYELVLGVRDNRDSDSFLKRTTAQSFYRLLNKLGIKCVYNHADFRLMSLAMVQELKKFPERVRFLRGLIFEIESKYAVVYYKRRKREAGKSKFTLKSLFGLALDGITSFSSVPIRIVTMLGFFMFFLSLVGLGFVLWVKIVRGVEVPGWAFLSVIILFFGGIQNMSLGVIGEYIAKIFSESKARPIFIVRKLYRHGDE